MRAAAVVFAGTFAGYALVAAPTVSGGDGGELTAAAFTLGVAHETGFALYCLLGRAIAWLPVGDVAFRLAMLSALGAAAAAALTAATGRRLAVRLGATPLTAELAGGAGGLVLAGGLTFFGAATTAEVYGPTAALFALAVYAFVRAVENRAQERLGALLLALIGGLSLGLHAELRILMGPPIVVWAIWRLRAGARWPLFGPALLAVGAAIVFYLPLRAARAPAADWADPLTLSALWGHLTAARIRAAFVDEMFPPRALAFDHLRRLGHIVEGQLAAPALLAAAGGLIALARRTPLVGAVLAFVICGDVAYATLINPMGLADLQCGVPIAIAIAVCASVGVAAASIRLGPIAPYAAAVLACCVAAPALVGDAAWKLHLGAAHSRPARALLDDAPPRALALVTSDDLAATLLYEQLVGGARPDVTVLVRQQLGDAHERSARIARAGHTVDVPVTTSEPELLRALVARGGVLWEPGPDAPPWPPSHIELGATAVVLQARPAATPSPAALEAQLDALLDGAPAAHRRAATLVALGRLAYNRADEPAATALFEGALRADPSDGAAAVNLAVLAARHNDFRGAAALVEGVVAREPERVVARVNLGRYRLQLGELDDAYAAFYAAGRRAPHDPGPLCGLARVAIARNRPDDARRAIDRALRVAPQDPEARALDASYGKMPRSE